MADNKVEQGRRFRPVLVWICGLLVAVVAVYALFLIARWVGRDPEGAQIAESERLEGLYCHVSWRRGAVVLKPEDAGEATAVLREALCQKCNTDITSFGMLAPITHLSYRSMDAHGREPDTEFIIQVFDGSHIRLHDIRVASQNKWLKNKALVDRIDRLVESLRETDE